MLPGGPGFELNAQRRSLRAGLLPGYGFSVSGYGMGEIESVTMGFFRRRTFLGLGLYRAFSFFFAPRFFLVAIRVVVFFCYPLGLRPTFLRGISPRLQLPGVILSPCPLMQAQGHGESK